VTGWQDKAANQRAKAETIAAYVRRLNWDLNTFKQVVGAFPERGHPNPRTRAAFARRAYRTAGVQLREPGSQETWLLVMQLLTEPSTTSPDLAHEAALWTDVPAQDPPPAADCGPVRGWPLVAALPPVPGMFCRCGQPAVVRTPTKSGAHRWRCPGHPPEPGEWGYPRPGSRYLSVNFATTPETCTCATTWCLCGRRPTTYESEQSA